MRDLSKPPLDDELLLPRQAGAELPLVGVEALPSVPGEIDEVRDLDEEGRAEARATVPCRPRVCGEAGAAGDDDSAERDVASATNGAGADG